MESSSVRAAANNGGALGLNMTTLPFFSTNLQMDFPLVSLKRNLNINNSILSSDTITNNDIIQSRIWVKR